MVVPDDEIRLKQYQVWPSSPVARAGGTPLQVIGDIELYGRSRYAFDVVQSMTLFNANGEKLSDTPQIAKVESVDGAGQYRAVGVYKIAPGMEQGQYIVQSVLFLDGREVTRRDISFHVARDDVMIFIDMSQTFRTFFYTNIFKSISVRK